MVLHPSLLLLTRLQLRGGARRSLRKLRKPKNLLSVLVAVAFAAMWLATAATAASHRETSDSSGFAAMMALSLSAYVGWHVIRIACFRPEHPLEQPENERELLSSLPLRPSQIVVRHVWLLGFAAAAKAALLTVLLLPEIHIPAVGWAGILAGLLVVEMFRQLLEIAAWAAPRGVYIAFRGVVCASLVVGGIPMLAFVHQDLAEILARRDGNLLGLFSDAAASMVSTKFGSTLAVVWTPVTNLIAGNGRAIGLALSGALSIGWILGLGAALQVAYRQLTRLVVQREQRRFESASQQFANTANRTTAPQRVACSGYREIAFRLLPCGGMGSLCWRQSKGAARHAWGLAVAMIPPAALALTPISTEYPNEATFLSVVCALAFYTFLLLPTALKFDFRRDLDRLGLLKSLPVSAWSVAVGQIAVPVALATGFQFTVLAIHQVVRPVAPQLPALAGVLLSLMNCLVFAVDNLVFLKSPHRLQQEGLAVLLRTMLTFAAKGLLFGLGLAATFAWKSGAVRLADQLASRGVGLDANVLFVGGVFLALLICVATATIALAHVFSRFDPAEHSSAS